MPIPRLKVLIPVILFVCSGLYAAQEGGYQLKAAYVYHISKFVNWPEQAFSAPDAPLVIGAIKANKALLHYLGELEGKVVNGRRITVQRVKKAEDAAGCQLLFIGDMDKKAFKGLMKHVSRQPVLTVSDRPSFSQAGGVVALVTVKNRLRMLINLEEGRAKGLQFSSKLLEIATLVEADGVE